MAIPTLNLSVPEEAQGQRLDRFLATAQADLSRSRLQGLIGEGLVRVNGEPVRASHRLRSGDAIALQLPAPDELGRLEPEAIPLDIVFEDEWLLVIDKPPGLVVHPGAGVRRGTLAHALLHHAPEIEHVGGAGRPGIVHRLDKGTSGLMVAAKRPRSWRALVAAIQQREVTRVYHALVWGDPREAVGTIDLAIGRDPRTRTRMAIVRSGGKAARTGWRVLERFGVATLVEARLETGRTHQIRVHFEHLGHAVVGDATYGSRGKKQLSATHGQRSLAATLDATLARPALHAFELAFVHPVTGESLRFSRPVPEDFARALELLGARNSGPSRVPRS